MEHNEVRDSLKKVPTFTLPPPPRFDEAASAVARRVEPLPQGRFQSRLWLNRGFLRLNRRSKLLALMAIVGLASGAAGGMLVVQQDKQEGLVNSSSMIQMPAEQPATRETATSPTPDETANLEVTGPVESPVRPRRTHRRARRVLTNEQVVLSNADDEDRDKHDGDDKDKNDDRKRNPGDRTRQGAVLYDVLRTRKP